MEDLENSLIASRGPLDLMYQPRSQNRVTVNIILSMLCTSFAGVDKLHENIPLGFDLDSVVDEKKGATLMDLAIQKQRYSIITYLCRQGAGVTAEHLAVEDSEIQAIFREQRPRRLDVAVQPTSDQSDPTGQPVDPTAEQEAISLCEQNNAVGLREFLTLHPISLSSIKTLQGDSLLHIGVRNGCVEMITFLVEEAQHPLDIQGQNQKTPLHVACAMGNEACVVQLCGYGANTEVRDVQGRTPLFYVTTVELLQYLIEIKQAEVSVTDKYQRHLLHHILQMIYDESVDRTQLFDYVLQNANLDPFASAKDVDDTVLDAFGFARRYKCHAELQLLQAKFPQVMPTPKPAAVPASSPDRARFSSTARPLNFFSESALRARNEKIKVDGENGILTMLIQNGVVDELLNMLKENIPLGFDLDRVVDKESGATMMDLAIQHKRYAMITYLCRQGAAVSTAHKPVTDPLIRAILNEQQPRLFPAIELTAHQKAILLCEQNDVVALRKLLTHHQISPSSIKTPEGDSMVHIAVRNSSIEMFEFLLGECQHPVDIQDHDQKTPLHLACEMGNLTFAKLLCCYGANKESMDKFGRTPVFYTSTNEFLELLRAKPARESSTSQPAPSDSPELSPQEYIDNIRNGSHTVEAFKKSMHDFCIKYLSAEAIEQYVTQLASSAIIPINPDLLNQIKSLTQLMYPFIEQIITANSGFLHEMVKQGFEIQESFDYIIKVKCGEEFLQKYIQVFEAQSDSEDTASEDEALNQQGSNFSL